MSLTSLRPYPSPRNLELVAIVLKAQRERPLLSYIPMHLFFHWSVVFCKAYEAPSYLSFRELDQNRPQVQSCPRWNSSNNFALCSLSYYSRSLPSDLCIPSLHKIIQLTSPVTPQMAPPSWWMKFPLNTIYSYSLHSTYVLVPLPTPATSTHSKDTPTMLHGSIQLWEWIA